MDKRKLVSLDMSDTVVVETRPKPVRNRWVQASFVMMMVAGAFAVLGGLLLWRAYYCQRHPQQASQQSVGQAQEPFSFDDIFSGEYVPKSVSGSWSGKDSDVFVYSSQTGHILAYDPSTDTTAILMDNTTYTQLNAQAYFVSPDRRFILLLYNITAIWRYSMTAVYKIYDRDADPTNAVIEFPQDDKLRNTELQYAGWGREQNVLSFVSGNNLYFQADPYTASEQLTTTGQDKFVFNGVPDWLYEEDVLSSPVTHSFSPDELNIAYAEFNTAQVPVFKMPWYGDTSDVYPTTVEFTYPKAGYLPADSNTKVKLYVVSVVNPSSKVQLEAPPEVANEDHYYTRMEWLDNRYVLVYWANRPQNKTYAYLCDIVDDVCQKNMEIIVTDGWCDVPFPRPWNVEGRAVKQYITILPKNEGTSGAWKQVALVTAPNNAEGQVTFLTSGTQEVLQILGIDQGRGYVYYQSTNGDPKKRHIFRAVLPDVDPPVAAPDCLTCDLSPDCQYVSPSFSNSARFYVRGCRGPGVPTYHMVNTENNEERLLEDNAELISKLADKAMPTKQFLQVDIGGGYKAWAEMWLPPNFNPESSYPLLIFTYAGPGSQRVSERFPLGNNQIDWTLHLASSHNVVVASFDGRGSAARGDKFKFELYRQLATKEVEDQILGAQYLMNNYPYIDKSRTAIWGWSYGGNVASHALGNESDTYKCGIAVAPTINRKYYDTAHTERYLGLATPSDNEAGYNATDVTRKVENFRNKKYLLAHGSADDNVHYQHAAQMIRALTEAEIQFSQHIYIDKNHSIRGGTTRYHLFKALTNFILRKCYS